LRASDSTGPSGAASQAVASPVEASIAARFDLDWPPAWEKVPPTYTTPPPAAMLRTGPSSAGAQPATELSARMWARLVRGAPPTPVNCPPTNQPPEPSGVTQ